MKTPLQPIQSLSVHNLLSGADAHDHGTDIGFMAGLDEVLDRPRAALTRGPPCRDPSLP